MLRYVIFGMMVGALLGGAAPAVAQERAKPQTTGKKLVVGFSQVGAESAWRTAETKSIKAEAAKRGVELKFAIAQQRQGNQIKAVRSFIAQRVDVIVIAPIVETGWERVLREAQRAGIPVILVDRGVTVRDDSLYITLIASDFVEEGRMAAEWLAKKMNGKANIVELQGTTGSAPAIDRKKGFEEALKKHAGMKIIKSQSADFTRAKGKEVMEAFIKSDRDRIEAVYAHNDDMALGAIQALEEAGIKPGKDVIIISVDAVRAAFEAMVAGKLNATVECNPLFGPILFDTIEKLRAGEKLPKYIKNEDRLFDQSVAAELIDSREY
ncbi:MAG TPA: ABC transporter substrate-binding protein [Phycisphaerae bacterium]|nr:ABC transporter substrate-binding protein [Phycisphaerae bacterium]